ncbi:hypothetical protein I4U23_001639 [Adineta vaga]|nr:hypothetical protein I4U23_001639 [Adineta vaga]
MTMLPTYSYEFMAKTVGTTANVMNTSQTITTTTVSLLAIKSPVIILIWFEIITASIIYGFGFIGNLFASMIFFSKDEFRKISTGILFLLMTLSNTIHLWTLTTEFLGTFNVYIYLNEFLQCRLNYFIQNVSRSVSTYIAITVTVDRLLRSEIPLRSRHLCTRQNALKLSLIYLIVSSVFYSFWFFPMNSINPTAGGCYTGRASAYTFFFSNIFLPLRFIFVCLIPVVIISLANLRMLFNIRRSRRRVIQASEMTRTSGTSNERLTSLDRMLFRMMLVNVGVFIITQIPFHIYTIVRTYNRGMNAFDAQFIRAALLIWSSIYFGMGSYFYCLASPIFSRALLQIIKKVTFYQVCHQR